MYMVILVFVVGRNPDLAVPRYALSLQTGKIQIS